MCHFHSCRPVGSVHSVRQLDEHSLMSFVSASYPGPTIDLDSIVTTQCMHVQL